MLNRLRSILPGLGMGVGGLGGAGTLVVCKHGKLGDAYLNLCSSIGAWGLGAWEGPFWTACWGLLGSKSEAWEAQNGSILCLAKPKLRAWEAKRPV